MKFDQNKTYLLFKLLYRGFVNYKLQIFILIVLGLLGGILEGVGIAAVIPLFTFVSGNTLGAANPISKIIQDFFELFNFNFSLKYLLVFISSLFILRAVVLIFCNYIKIKISADYEEQTRNYLLKKTLKATWPFLLSQKLGHLENLLMMNVWHSGLLLQYISAALINLSGLAMYIFVAMNISLSITLITIGLGFFVFIFFRPIIYKIKSISKERNIINKSIAHYVNENIMGMKTIKAMFVGEHIALSGNDYFKRIKELFIKSSFLKIISEASMEPIGLVFICVIFAIDYKMANFNPAAFVAVIYLIQRMFVYIQQFQANVQAIAETSSYLKNILEYDESVNNNIEIDIGLKKFIFFKKLEFKNLSFAYNKQKSVLLDINFSIKKGEMIGLIGPSGAGKTTIVDLILRLFDPVSGTILLDGLNIKDIDLGDWRKNIGYVSQDIFLMNDTIANNIRFYNENILDEEIESAAKMAHIFDFIKSLPLGFNTVIGERGVLLSAGQRQRMVIARILARKPEILILDEATSALDNESETQIQKVIEGLKNKITVLVIAHRLSTIINSDRLLVLDNGMIVEDDDPQELLKNKNSYFFKMYNIKNN